MILGVDGYVFGEDGNDTLISHHGAKMTGGLSNDIFGFVVSESIKNMSSALFSKTVHSINDFKQGEDKIHLYFSDDLLSNGAMNTANTDHVKKQLMEILSGCFTTKGKTPRRCASI